VVKILLTRRVSGDAGVVVSLLKQIRHDAPVVGML
jgi:hypothetical protein